MSKAEALREQLIRHPVCATCFSHDVIVAATGMRCVDELVVADDGVHTYRFETKQSVCKAHDESSNDQHPLE